MKSLDFETEKLEKQSKDTIKSQKHGRFRKAVIRCKMGILKQLHRMVALSVVIMFAIMLAGVMSSTTYAEVIKRNAIVSDSTQASNQYSLITDKTILPILYSYWRAVDIDSWYFYDSDGSVRTGWIYDNGWYYLSTKEEGTAGLMKYGWYQDNSGAWYFLNTVHDGTFGRAVSGWQWIDGYSYFFDENCRLVVGANTHDGYAVDSDDDGLPDSMEMFLPRTSPISMDGNADGILDIDEDSDDDGLSNGQEYKLGTNLSLSDTDMDGLIDGDEVLIYFTDPLREDTDEDGVSDYLEIQVGSDPLVAEESFDITFAYGASVDYVTVPSVSFTSLSAQQVNDFGIYAVTTGLLANEEIVGYIDHAYSFSETGEFGEATLTFEVDENLFTDADFSPAIYWYNEQEQLFEKLANQEIDGNKISAKITHFSKYIVLDSAKHDKIWEYELLYDDSEVQTYQGMDIVFVIDASGSMSTNDPNRVRVDVTKNFITRYM